MMRLFPLLAALVLAACEGSLGVSLSATPPEDVSAAVLRVTAVNLEQSDGSTRRIDIDPDLDIDLLGLDRGNTAALLSGEEIGAGNYRSLTLVLAAESQILDSYLEDSAGGQTSLILTPGSTATATGDYRVRDEEDTQLTVHFDLRSSLLPESNAAGDRQMTPRLRVLESAEAGTVAGDVDAELLNDAGCDSATEIGRVVYVYSGNVTPDDLDGNAPEPLSTALLRISDSQADYVASFLPAGDYTVAVSCNADQDDPALDDDIGFVASDTVSISAGSTATLNFTP